MQVSVIAGLFAIVAAVGSATPIPQDKSVVRLGHDREAASSSGHTSEHSDELSDVGSDSEESGSSAADHSDESSKDEPSESSSSESSSESSSKDKSSDSKSDTSDEEPDKSTVFVDQSTEIISASNPESDTSAGTRATASLVSLAVAGGVSVLLAAF